MTAVDRKVRLAPAALKRPMSGERVEPARKERVMEGAGAAAMEPMNCPCCKQPVTAPTLEIVVDRYGVTPLQARILGAVWRGKGMPVQTERIFDAMYVDDADGGPSPTRMYAAFKVALCHLRTRLEGSGIGIENVGYRQGYRLVMAGKITPARRS
ncbi:hypothetical protein [Rhizobium sp. R339]|uniref:hypothetical protein n=1 Tax=Rhizobium sp. R339 TaxID=1764273 RepID=UPI001FDA23E4|nr:hypothetical protein [Rhizobium sp. R339]